MNVSLALQVIYEVFLTYLSLVGFLSTVSLSLKRTVTSEGFPTHLTLRVSPHCEPFRDIEGKWFK